MIWHRKLTIPSDTDDREKEYKDGDIEIFWHNKEVDSVYMVVNRDRCKLKGILRLEGPTFGNEVVDGRFGLHFEVLTGSVKVIPVTKLARKLYKVIGEDEKWLIVKI